MPAHRLNQQMCTSLDCALSARRLGSTHAHRTLPKTAWPSEFSWGDGDTSDWSELVPSGYPVHTTHVWLDTGIYEVSAQASDEDGATSGWTEGDSISVRAIKWRYPAWGAIWSCPAVSSDGTVYVGEYGGTVFAIDSNGVLKWECHEIDDSIASSLALAQDGTVYVGSIDSCLYAIDPNGSLKWLYRTKGKVYSSPAIAPDGTVYVGSYDGYL
jgi:outer membrane protein assembly factor BamB